MQVLICTFVGTKYDNEIIISKYNTLIIQNFFIYLSYTQYDFIIYISFNIILLVVNMVLY